MIAAKLIASAALAGTVLTPYQARGSGISPTAFDELFGVTATSPSNAWAVGLYVSAPPGFHAHALTEHWNGRAWIRVAAPAPAGQTDIQLNGVAATSSSSAWAVGFFDTSGGLARTVIEHWNGRAWKIQASPDPGTYSDFLEAVYATSPTDVWAVGDYADSLAADHTLIEHWNGRTWTHVPSPDPGTPGSPADLSGVAATGSSSAWAVGTYSIKGQLGILTLTEHWNGRAWKLVASPNPAGSANLNQPSAVTATSATSAWMAGTLSNQDGSAVRAFAERWNGRSWRQARTADPGSASTLFGVAATSSSSVWAVGTYGSGPGPDHTLIERWNGRAWKRVASPTPAGAKATNLKAVTAASPASTWAVGSYVKGTQVLTLIEHWNGTAWKQVTSANV
jgi:hypothetical protein